MSSDTQVPMDEDKDTAVLRVQKMIKDSNAARNKDTLHVGKVGKLRDGHIVA